MHLYNGGLKPKAQCGNLLKGSQKIVLEKLQTLAFYFNRHIFQVLRTGGTSISGILPKLGPMRLFLELVKCELERKIYEKLSNFNKIWCVFGFKCAE